MDFWIPAFHLFLKSFAFCGPECSALVATGGGGLDNTSSMGAAAVDVFG